MNELRTPTSEAEHVAEQLDWSWVDWRDWARELLATHTHEQVAETLADMGHLQNLLREGMGSEAMVVAAQALSLNPKVLGKSRREIIVQQIERMLKVAVAQGPPRSMVRWGGSWSERARSSLASGDWKDQR